MLEAPILYALRNKFVAHLQGRSESVRRNLRASPVTARLVQTPVKNKMSGKIETFYVYFIHIQAQIEYHDKDSEKVARGHHQASKPTYRDFPQEDGRRVNIGCSLKTAAITWYRCQSRSGRRNGELMVSAY